MGIGSAPFPTTLTPVPTLNATHPAGPALSTITSPEAAGVALKAKLSTLHALVNNVGHVGALAFDEIEQLLADIRWLAAYIRSKV